MMGFQAHFQLFWFNLESYCTLSQVYFIDEKICNKYFNLVLIASYPYLFLVFIFILILAEL